MENLYGKKIKLYDWQKEVNPAEDSFVIAPTGAGKSIAAYRWAFDDSDKKVIFTAPIKALSNERYLELKRIYKDKVGILTGDVKKNVNAPILCMTQEIYTSHFAHLPNQKVVIDEVHYMFQDRNRSRAYVDGIINTNPQSKLMLLSATVSENVIPYFERISNRKFHTIIVKERPVQLKYINNVSLQDAVKNLTPFIIFVFSSKGIIGIAKALRQIRNKEIDSEKLTLLEDYIRFFNIDNELIIDLAKRGIGIYFGSMKVKEKLFTETMVRKGIIDAVVGTDALALGVNLPVKTVLFGQLAKYYDGPITKREFLQMSGRAGRPNLHEIGYVGYVRTPYEAIGFDTGMLYNTLIKKELEEEEIIISIDYKKIISSLSWDDINKKRLSSKAREIIKDEASYIANYSLTKVDKELVYQYAKDEIVYFLKEIKSNLSFLDEPEPTYKLLQTIYYNEMPLHTNIYCAEYIMENDYLDAIDFYYIHAGSDTQRDMLQFYKFCNILKQKGIDVRNLDKLESLIKEDDEFVINPDKIEDVNQFLHSRNISL